MKILIRAKFNYIYLNIKNLSWELHQHLFCKLPKNSGENFIRPRIIKCLISVQYKKYYLVSLFSSMIFTFSIRSNASLTFASIEGFCNCLHRVSNWFIFFILIPCPFFIKSSISCRHFFAPTSELKFSTGCDANKSTPALHHSSS